MRERRVSLSPRKRHCRNEPMFWTHHFERPWCAKNCSTANCWRAIHLGSLNTVVRKWAFLCQKRTVLLWMIISLDPSLVICPSQDWSSKTFWHCCKKRWTEIASRTPSNTKGATLYIVRQLDSTSANPNQYGGQWDWTNASQSNWLVQHLLLLSKDNRPQTSPWELHAQKNWQD